MDKELIDHITTQLQNHEEAYSSGAWEGFSEKDKKKNGFAYWPLWSAAALILIFGGIFFITDKDAVKNKIAFQKPKSTTENRVPEVKKEKHNDQKINHKDYKNPPNEEIFVSALKDKHNGSLILLNKAGNIGPNPASNTVRILSYNILENRVSDYNLSSKNIQPAEFYTAEKRKPASVSKITFEDLLARDSHTDQFKKTPKISQDSKWQPGIYVAPAMGNDNKVNMNYGFSLSYAIANKLSISSGIAYNALSTTEALDAGAPQTLSGRNLESVDARVRGINIPLELKYKINDKLYTEIGVSALAVLNNKQQNNYILNQVQNVSYSTANGLADQKTLIVKERTSEPKPEANIDPDRYIGFYNFSFGYKQKISRKKNIAIEPFLRLPMKTFSKDNLNLTNGGLKLKIDF